MAQGSGSAANVADVTLSLDTSAYASGDVLAETQVVSNAMRAVGRIGMLVSVVLIDEDDQKAALSLLFFSGNVSFGTENAAPSITDAGARQYLGKVDIATTDYQDVGGVSIAVIKGIEMLLRPAAGTMDIYIAALNGSGTPTYTAAGLTARLGIIQ